MESKFNIPKGWNEVTVEDFLELRSLETEEFVSFYSKQVSILSILCLVDETEFEEMDIDELGVLMSQLKWLHTQPSVDFKDTVDDLHMIELNKLTFGQFLDIEHFISDDYYKNINLIAAIVYGKQRIGEWGETLFEPYGKIDIWKRADTFKDILISDIFGIIHHILTWRQGIMDIYSNIFQPTIDDKDSDDEMSAEDLKEEEDEQKLEKFYWQFLINDLTDNDVTKIGAVTDLPLIQVMNYITTKKLR